MVERVFARKDERRRPIRDARSVAGRNRPIPLEGWRQLGQRFQRRVRARRLVFTDHQRRAFFASQRDRHDLSTELAAVPRRHRPAVRAQRKFVLFLASDLELLRDELRGVAHVHVLERVPKPIVHRRVD